MATKDSALAFKIDQAAEGDGKALVCCTGNQALELVKPSLERRIADLDGEKLSAFMANALAEGDGKALVCCTGSSKFEAA